MLERENIDNFIADDLALRNRNWGKIEDELAEKATVTELTDGLDARYTKDETDGLLEAKADSLAMENLITNGDFSQELTGWSGTVQRSPENGGLNLKYTNNLSSTSYNNAYQQISFSAGNAYYISYKLTKVDTSNIGNTYSFFQLGSQILSSTNSKRIGSFSLVEIKNSTPETRFYINTVVPPNETLDVTYDDILLVNLTETFGAGNEPTAPEMDKLIDLLGGWFDGEITVSQKTLAVWLLNLIRQNSNAIIALGGTII